jgi:hypothetical protein
MATSRHPNQNVNVPMRQGAVDAARGRLDPGRSFAARQPPDNTSRGSRRQVRPGEWIDDRRIDLDKPASPSEDSPPDLPGTRATPPASYDPAKVYSITLGKPAVFAGRTLAPGKEYQMAGYACAEVSASIIDAVELGDIPADPASPPS